MSNVSGANLSAPLSYPISVRYEAVRTTWRHEDDGELGAGFITIKPNVPSPQEPDKIPCKCELQWGYLVTPAKPEFICKYSPSDDRFVDFKEPRFLEDSIGEDSGYRESDDAAIMEMRNGSPS